jgi:hypothetical protein
MRTRLLGFALTFGLVLLTGQTNARLINSSTVEVAATTTAIPPRIPAPRDVLGFVPGDDRKLASWDQVIEYFSALAKTSDRVRFETLGQSTMGRALVMATISAPENLARLDEFRKVQELLADPRQLGPPRDRDRKAAELIKRGKTVVLITCGIHSTEVGSYLSSMLIAHHLAVAQDADTESILRNTIILLVPALNPDGVDIVKNWYDKTLGTPYEGTEPPELYHKYTGHDDNRDWYAFTQVETQIAVGKIHNVWHPHIVHDIHQQGQFGARLFSPPYMAPVEPNVPKQIVAGYTELGNYIARELRAANLTGITTNSTYDAWSPSRAYSHYHGGVRILSETASCKLATPITVEFNQLKKDVGYDPKKESATFGPLWRGGEWHLRDITSYMTSAAFLLLRHASEHRKEWLSRFYEIGKEAVRPRLKGELYAFVIPASEHSGALEQVLEAGGLTVDHPGAFTVGKRRYAQGSAVVRLAQPYGSFAKSLLEVQQYPNLRDSSGNPIQPYDAAAHTLSLLMGVTVKPIFAPFVLPRRTPERGVGENGGCGDAHPPRRAIYKSWVPAIDEGWTRWVLDRELSIYRCLYYSRVDDKTLHAGNLRASFDSIIIPDQEATEILNGYKAGTMPPEYTGGLGAAGVKALREFVEQGGTLVCLNRASSFAIEQFKLPLRDVVADVSDKEFFVPGSILRIELDTANPIAQGMPRESIAWVEDSPVFEVVDSERGGGPTVRQGERGSSPTVRECEPGSSPTIRECEPGGGPTVRQGERGSSPTIRECERGGGPTIRECERGGGPTIRECERGGGPTVRQGERGSSPTVREGFLPKMHRPTVRVIARYPTDRSPLLSGWLLGEKRIRGKAALVEVTMGKGRIILFGFRPQYRGQSLATYPLLFNAIAH